MKYTILLFFLLGFTLKVSSQELRFGALAGINAISIHPVNQGEFEHSSWSTTEFFPMLSYNINGYAAYRFKNNVGISIEPGYITKGAETKYSIYDFRYEQGGPYSKVRKHYIYTPLFFDWYFSNRFSFSVGPEFAYQLYRTTNEFGEKKKSDSIDKPFQLSGIIGFNFEIIDNLDLGIRYSHEIPHNNDKYYIFHHYLQFMVRFKIKKEN